MQTRKSILLPWGGGDGTEFTLSPSTTQQPLGYCIEQSNENGLQVSTGLYTHHDSGSKPDISNELHLSFPTSDVTGEYANMSSELWPSAIASSILLNSPEFRNFSNGKSLLELGSGVGLAGLVAARDCSSCVLTDVDERAVQLLHQATHKNHLPETVTCRQLDWRDNHDASNPVDIILGSDIAYYYHLLRPIMDTTRAFLKQDSVAQDSLLIIVGGASRESQWDLYHNIRDGCYNQITDVREPPWLGKTKMVLFHLKMSNWVEDNDETDVVEDDDEDSQMVPISVIIHQPPSRSGISSNDPSLDTDTIMSLFKEFEYVATETDDRNMLKSF